MKAPRSFAALLLPLSCCFSLSAAASDATPRLQFPLQFSATLRITADTIPETQRYPPRHRRMRVWYDYVQKLAKAEVEAGYEAAKLQLRRYDQVTRTAAAPAAAAAYRRSKWNESDEWGMAHGSLTVVCVPRVDLWRGQRNEYVVWHDPINDCMRSYLGEAMPFPELPKENVQYLGLELVRGEDGRPDVLCNHWLFTEYNDRIRMYMDAETGGNRADTVGTPKASGVALIRSELTQPLPRCCCGMHCVGAQRQGGWCRSTCPSRARRSRC